MANAQNKRFYERQEEKDVPILPLKDLVLYPNVLMPVYVGRPQSLRAVALALAQDRMLILVPQKDDEIDHPSINDLCEYGTMARVVQDSSLSNSTIKLMVEGLYRVKITHISESGGLFTAQSQAIHEVYLDEDKREIEVLRRTVLNMYNTFLEQNNKKSDELINVLEDIKEPGRLTDTIMTQMPLRMKHKIKILETVDYIERLQNLIAILEEELSYLEIEKEIREKVKVQLDKNQREYFLNEQLKVIRKELLESNKEEFPELEKIQTKIKEKHFPQEVVEKAESELKKLYQMSGMSAEATVIRNYLDWLLDFPWTESSETCHDLKKAKDILNRDHYALEDVKERILEYLAVQKRSSKHLGPILCFVGPPGVGKTSLGQSIAEAVGRNFVRLALGGVHDEAEIRGHRRTYIGSMPGKIVQLISKAKTNNPLFLLDEVDKLGMDYRGDPAAALLEVLDPAQNHAFSDHYMEIDVDLSKVLFIATANTMNIPVPLLDRMEVIRLPGYTVQEKIEIANRHIVPRQMEANVLSAGELCLRHGVIEQIIENYTREAGVRNLEREIAKLARKAVKMIEFEDRKKIVVTPNNLPDYLGIPKYQREKIVQKERIGCVTGLAWTEVGGELLQIESVVLKGKGKLDLTGQMGDVMKESVHAALSVVRHYLDRYSVDCQLDKKDIHIHMPEGAIPKDGPSAGIAITTALFSALTDIPVRANIAMTGEITLQGNVLAIGGLKEKLIAAQREQIKTVLIPQSNEKDLQDVPEDVRNSLEIILVKHIEDVLKYALNQDDNRLKNIIGAYRDYIPSVLQQEIAHSCSN